MVILTQLFTCLASLAPFLLHAEEINWNGGEGPFSIQIALSNSSLVEGDLLKAKITLTYPQSFHIDKDDIVDQILFHTNPLQPQWLIVGQTVRSEVNSGLHKIETELQLTPNLTGSLNFSLLDLTFLPEGVEKGKTFFTPIFKIKVKPSSGITDEEFNQAIEKNITLTPLEPKFPIDLDFVNQNYLDGPERLLNERIQNQKILQAHSFPWISLVIGALGSTFCLLGVRYGKTFGAKRQPIESPQLKALRALEQLKEQNLPAQGQFKEFDIVLTQIVKRYLEEQFNVRALSQTTDECLRNASIGTDFSPERQAILANFLVQCDVIKFSNLDRSRKECALAYELAIKLIQK